MDWLERAANLLGAQNFVAHSICLSGDFSIITIYELAHFAIFVSYMVIGGILLFVQIYTHLLPVRDSILIGSFVVLCGLGHLIAIAVLFSGIYYLEMIILGMTASASVLTAFVIVGSVRHALQKWKSDEHAG